MRLCITSTVLVWSLAKQIILMLNVCGCEKMRTSLSFLNWFTRLVASLVRLHVLAPDTAILRTSESSYWYWNSNMFCNQKKKSLSHPSDCAWSVCDLNAAMVILFNLDVRNDPGNGTLLLPIIPSLILPSNMHMSITSTVLFPRLAPTISGV